MNGADLFWLAPALPLAAAALLVLGLGRSGRMAAGLAIAALAGSATVSILGLLAVTQGLRAGISLPWLDVGGRAFTVALSLDPLSALVVTLVSVVALLVFVYAASYMAGDPRVGRFFTVFSLFAGAMLTLVLAADLLVLFIAWELVGLCSFLLIGFWFERPGVPAAATKAFLTTRVADQAMLAGVLLLAGATGTGRIDAILEAAHGGQLAPSLLLIAALLLFAGAAGKSAQVPFHGWLPDAMAGPTPVSALLHSATMVAAGVFLVARLYPLYLAAGPALSVVAWVGALTALLGAAAALVQADLKRTLAYSTMSQLGLMFVGLGSGSLVAGVLLLVAQALYKAPLFLAAGAVGHEVKSTAFERMGGLARRMPYTFVVFAIGAAALAGLPVTLALPPKDAVLAAAFEANTLLFATVLLASLLTALYSARTFGLVFLGTPAAPARRVHEAPWGFLAPMLVLAGLVVIGLLADAPIVGHPLGRLLGGEAPEADIVTMLALTVAVSGVVLGFVGRRVWPSTMLWPPLAAVAGVFAGEFGLQALYRAVPRLGLWTAEALSVFDRGVFDPLGARMARAAVGTVQQLSRFDRAVFDPLGVRLARAVVGVVQRASHFDRSVFDAAAGLAAGATIGAVRASARFDLRRIDATFNRFGQALLAASQRLRGLQTGRIENYLLAIFVWSLGVIGLALLAIAVR